MDIIKYKKDICTIASISTGKSLIYHSILIIIKKFELIILSIIIFMEDKICISSKMLYNHSLYLIV